MDMDQRTKNVGGRSGRIILLGDGTEVLTDSADTTTDMFDDAEDKDLESQVSKGQAGSKSARGDREGTPGPIGVGAGASNTNQETPDISQEPASLEDSPMSTKIEISENASEPSMKAASDTALSPGQQKKTESS